jgi:hypothetical protein
VTIARGGDGSFWQGLSSHLCSALYGAFLEVGNVLYEVRELIEEVKELDWGEVQIRDFVAARKSANPHLSAAVGIVEDPGGSQTLPSHNQTMARCSKCSGKKRDFLVTQAAVRRGELVEIIKEVIDG